MEIESSSFASGALVIQVVFRSDADMFCGRRPDGPPAESRAAGPGGASSNLRPAVELDGGGAFPETLLSSGRPRVRRAGRRMPCIVGPS